jgi:hypothetical protein
MRSHADLIHAAHPVAAQYSDATGALLETLVRELTRVNAERVLELVRRVDAEARRAAREEQLAAAAGMERDVAITVLG